MNQIVVVLEFDSSTILKGNAINVKEIEDNRSIIIIENIILNNKIMLDKLSNKECLIRIEYGNECISINEFSFILITHNLLKNNSIEIITNTLPSLQEYNQLEVNVLSNQFDVQKWIQLDVQLKYYTIRKFLYDSGLPTELIIKNKYTLDCSYINDNLDIYYYLSISLLGVYKYIGIGLDSFYDCLIEINMHSKLKENILELGNFEKLGSNVEEEFKSVLDILQEFNFNIIY